MNWGQIVPGKKTCLKNRWPWQRPKQKIAEKIKIPFQATILPPILDFDWNDLSLASDWQMERRNGDGFERQKHQIKVL